MKPRHVQCKWKMVVCADLKREIPVKKRATDT